MSAFFSKLFTLLLSKIPKMPHLHCVVKFQLRKLGCALTWYENAVLQLRNCVALQLNEKVHCESWAALQKLKKIKLRILRCAFTGWKDRCALLSCAFGIMLFVPTSVDLKYLRSKIRAMYNIHKTIQGISNLSTPHGKRSLKLIASDNKTIMNYISILYFYSVFNYSWKMNP